MRKKKLFVCFIIFIITLSLFGCEVPDHKPSSAEEITPSSEVIAPSAEEITPSSEVIAPSPEKIAPITEEIDPAVALTLRKDYLQQLRSEDPKTEITLDDIYVQDYYGTYSGCEIVYMGAPLVYTMAERRVVVAGYIITLGSGHKLYVHKDSHFYTLSEAYITGCITKEDVEDFGPKVDEHYFKKWNGEKIWYDDGSITTNPVG